MEIINLKTNSDEKTSAPASPTSNVGTKSKNQITGLESCVRNHNRVNVFVDGSFCFSFDLAQVVDYRLKVGKILTPEELTKLRHASAFGKLYGQTLEWVLVRPRSTKETRDHLLQKLAKLEIDNRQRADNYKRTQDDADFKKFAENHKVKLRPRELFTKKDIEQVIETLQRKGYLDDYKFAEWFIENRFASKGVSPLRLQQELLKKGIDKNIIDELLENNPRDESAEIQKIIQKKGKKFDSKKLLDYLIRHGFSIDLSRELIAEYYDESTQDPELFV